MRAASAWLGVPVVPAKSMMTPPTRKRTVAMPTKRCAGTQKKRWWNPRDMYCMRAPPFDLILFDKRIV